MTRQVKGDKTPWQQSSPNKRQDKPANSASTSTSRPRANPINTADVHRSNEDDSANEPAKPTGLPFQSASTSCLTCNVHISSAPEFADKPGADTHMEMTVESDKPSVPESAEGPSADTDW
jgi:hypothetical protein